jgi:hypothetical protein
MKFAAVLFLRRSLECKMLWQHTCYLTFDDTCYLTFDAATVVFWPHQFFLGGGK